MKKNNVKTRDQLIKMQENSDRFYNMVAIAFGLSGLSMFALGYFLIKTMNGKLVAPLLCSMILTAVLAIISAVGTITEVYVDDEEEYPEEMLEVKTQKKEVVPARKNVKPVAANNTNSIKAEAQAVKPVVKPTAARSLEPQIDLDKAMNRANNSMSEVKAQGKTFGARIKEFFVDFFAWLENGFHNIGNWSKNKASNLNPGVKSVLSDAKAGFNEFKKKIVNESTKIDFIANQVSTGIDQKMENIGSHIKNKKNNQEYVHKNSRDLNDNVVEIVKAKVPSKQEEEKLPANARVITKAELREIIKEENTKAELEKAETKETKTVASEPYDEQEIKESVAANVKEIMAQKEHQNEQVGIGDSDVPEIRVSSNESPVSEVEKQLNAIEDEDFNNENLFQTQMLRTEDIKKEVKAKTNTRSISKKEIISQWRKENPSKNKTQCAKETGISPTTIRKYWN